MVSKLNNIKEMLGRTQEQNNGRWLAPQASLAPQLCFKINQLDLDSHSWLLSNHLK
jgi:hypothetical protein